MQQLVSPAPLGNACRLLLRLDWCQEGDTVTCATHTPTATSTGLKNILPGPLATNVVWEDGMTTLPKVHADEQDRLRHKNSTTAYRVGLPWEKEGEPKPARFAR